jgi:hypothetical protein
LLSIELGSDEDVCWTWCHHGEHGSFIIGYTILSQEQTDTPKKQPIGFFSLETKI